MDVGPSKSLARKIEPGYVWGITVCLTAVGVERLLLFFYHLLEDYIPATPKHVKDDIEMRAMKRRQGWLSQSVNLSFKDLDADGDGMLDAHEVYAALRDRFRGRESPEKKRSEE